MSYSDLREFIALLERNHELKRITLPVDPRLEVTEVCSRVLHNSGPALLFEKTNTDFPLLANLFGSTKRIAMAMGVDDVSQLSDIGELLAYLKQPDPPKGFKDVWQKIPLLKQVMRMHPKTVNRGLCQENIVEGSDIDLGKLPIQTCWSGDAGPLITWPLVVTQNLSGSRLNLGIYRQQVIAKNKVIMRWLSHRGGALDFQEWQQQYPDQPFPISVVIGADPATTLAAVTPIPDTLSEYAFAGLLRGKRTELVSCLSNKLLVPATAEFVLEGFIYPNDTAPEGPFGDHTGYYNDIETFPVFTIEKITHRNNPIYLSTYTGKPPDEPAMLGVALNEIFVPILKRQFPEIVDFYLPPEGCSYRLGIISIKKQYPGHAKRVMFGIWSFLRQFMYTKFLIVVDDDIDIRQWSEVIWALTTRMDPERDTTIISNTPIDYLDFASPTSGLGSKMGFDATNKMAGETQREWGNPIKRDTKTKQAIDAIWEQLGL